MRAAILRNLPEKTGRTADQWASLLAAERLSSRKEKVAWLKEKHGLGRVQASMVADYLDRPETFEERPPAELVEAQFSGDKKSLRPLYERLREELEALGDDVQAEPRQTYVAFTRGRQFALVQASTTDRVDVGLVLPNAEPTERLREAGSFGSGRITHRVGLKSAEAIDDDLRSWLMQAYAAAER
jgi:predicted transport protein